MVNIKGIIGDRPGEATQGELYVNLLSVIEQVQAEGQNDIHVLIDSVGGDLDAGFAIYNYLLNLPNRITTECVGNCASAASIIFLAGDERIAGCPIMIHNPYVDLKSISADKQTLESLAQWIGEKELQAEQIYTNRTKLDSQTLSALMDDETYISPNQAVSFGFSTQAKIIAVAKLNRSTTTNNTNNNSKTMSKNKSSIRELLGWKPKAKAMDLTTADGSTLTVNRDKGEPQIGDEASPDGTFTMPDGSVIVVADKKITAIKPVQNKGADLTPDEIKEVVALIETIIQENEELKNENEELKQGVASAKTKMKSDEDAAMLNAIMKAGGKDWFAKQCSHYKPQARIGRTGKNEIQKKESAISERLTEIKEKRGIN